MANPNIIGATSIVGKTDVLNVTTVTNSVTSNSAASGKVLKVNSLYAANVDGVNSADISIEVYRGAVSYYIAKNLAVLPNTSLVAITKDDGIYLIEGDAIRCTASADGDIQVVCSYEEIS